MSIKGFQIEGAVHRYDYNALDNKPVSDASLSVVGRFADAAAVGNAIAAIRKSGTNGGGSGEGVTSTRGTGIYKIVSPPVFYKANFGNFTSTYRIALATTKVQAGVTDVFVGDIIEYNIFHYPVGYVDKNYVYLGARTSIQGADGYSPTVSAQKTGTETVLTIVNKDEVTTATIFDGAPGRSVTGVTEYYKVSNDYVNPPPYGEDDPPWSTDPSAESAKLTPLIRYLWNYEVIHYSDGELSAPTTPVMIGVWGDSGKDGIGISDVLNYYWANNKTHLTEAEKRIQTCNEWTIEVQTTTESNPYLWNYEEIIYSDSNKAHKVTKPCIIGHYGADGFSPIVTASKSGNATTISITDKTGTKPPVVILDGAAATTYSLINSHPAIIKAADGSFTPAAITLSAKSQTGNDTPQDYAGIFKIDVYDGSSWSYGCYVSSVEEQTTQYTIPAGTQQICCSLYLDRATTILADQEIIGVVSNGTSVTITSKSVKYQKGTSGTNAPTGEWTNEIPSNINEGEYLWTRTVVNYSDGNSTISYSVSRYATNGTSPTVILTDVYYIQNNNGSTHPDENSSSWNPNPPSTTVPGQYVWTKTVVTYSDGATSVSYSVTRNGTDGEDAYTVILDNESHTFAGNESSAIRGSTVVTVYAYKGTDTATPIVNKNNITGMPNGMSVTSVSNSTGKAEITFDVTTSMTSRSGVITIPVTVGGAGGKVFNKLFSYSLALKGQRGIAIREVTNYYLASSQSSGVTSDDVDWTSDPTDEKAQISEQKPYLWNYEVVKGDLNQIISTTFPIIIGRYAQDGIPGTPGRGIVRIQEKYGVSSNSNTEPSTWYDEVQTTDAVNRYLWNYEIITYTSGTITQTTKKRIIGMYSEDGAPATAYSLIVSHAAIAKSASGTFAPASITLTAKSQTGTNAYANYSGRFKIEVHNGSSWSTKYTSSSNENTKSYTIPSGTTQVRCSLYLAGGTTTLLDQQTVPVVSDGTSVTITSKSVKYQKGTSGTTAPTGTWGDSIPSNIGENEYLWTQTIVNYSDGNSTEAYSVSRNAANGFSPTVSSTTVEYVESTSGTNQPTSGWNSTPPSTMTPGRYMWTKTTVAYDDGGSSVSYTVSRNGSDGGDAYTIILDNESHTFAGGTSAAIAGTATVNVYAYKGATAIAPTVTKANISGLPTGMTAQSVTNDSSNNKTTIVFAVTTSMTTRSGLVTIPVVADGKTFNKEFSYSLALQGIKGDTGDKGDKGDKGDSATAYSLIVSHAAIAKSVSGSFSPTSITLTAKSQTGANALANYSGRFKIEVHNGSSWSTKYTSSSNENTKSYTIPSGTTQVRCSLYLAGGTTTLLDQQTIPVVSDGAAGGDAYTVILDNESHTFAGGTSAAIVGTATVNVYAYKGATAIAPTVTKANISGLPTGMSVQSVTNDSTNKKSTIVFAVTTSMVTRSGMVTIPVVVDGKTFNKEFSYSLALQGTKGDTGDKGDKGDKGNKGDKGDKGDTGDRGATWYAGTGITGTSTTATIFSGSGVASAIVGDHYLNTSTQNVYRCTVAGAASTAKWVYEQNIKGARGTQGAKGDTGDTCYFHIKYSNDSGATFTGNSGEDAGSYIGTYSDNTEADSTSVSSYKWVKIEGDDGTSVTVSSIKYAVSTTESQPADSAFTHTSVPTVAEGSWLWTLTTYSNGSKAYTKAKQGQKGNAGTSVTVSSIKYAVSTTETQPADSSFTYTSVPTVAEGSWLWTLTTFSNGSKAYSKAKQGKGGTNGTTFTPSVDANGNISWTNDGGKTNPTAVNIKGPRGEAGVGVTSITKTGTSGKVDTYTIKYTDNTSTTFTVTNGTNGTNGTSAEWFYGTALTHTSGTATATISGAKVGDMYLNTATSNVYKCTAANTWTYAGNIADGVIDNISIGGRNLLLNTDDLTKWNKESGITVEWDSGVGMYKIIDTTHSSSRWGIYQNFPCEPNTTYTCSVEGLNGNISLGLGLQSFVAGNVGWSATKASSSNTKSRISATITTGSDHTVIRVYLHHTSATSINQYCYAHRPKLEKGNIATDWTPAPEDVAADIESAQTTADRKKQTFISTPTPPYYEGDAYFKTESGESGSAQWYVCTNTRLTAYGTGESWEDDFEPTSYALESSLQSTKTELLEEDKKIKASVEEQKTYTDGKVTPLETRTSTLEQAARDFTLTFNTEISGLKKRTENNENDLSSYQKVFAFTENGLQISEQRDKIQTPSVLQIDNGKISFIVDGQEASYWSGENSMFYVGDIVVGLNKKAQFGNFAWIPRSNGNLSFRWVGSSEDNN